MFDERSTCFCICGRSFLYILSVFRIFVSLQSVFSKGGLCNVKKRLNWRLLRLRIMFCRMSVLI